MTVVGVVGYVVIQGSTIHDALYMTVITLTAVGYSEVLPLTVMGRNFTMILLVGGINPAADTRLEPGDEMIVMGKPEQIAQLKGYVKA